MSERRPKCCDLDREHRHKRGTWHGQGLKEGQQADGEPWRIDEMVHILGIDRRCHNLMNQWPQRNLWYLREPRHGSLHEVGVIW